MQERLEKILSWLIILPAVLPLVYLHDVLYPYVTPKTLLFRTFGLLAISVFAYLAFNGGQFFWNRLRNKITWIPLGLLVWGYLSSILGLDFFHSFWSTFERGDGLLTLTIIVSYFYIVLLYVNKDFVNKLLKVIVWVGSLVALYGLLQWIQTKGIPLPFIEEPRGRVGGTLGNAAFLASYLSMTAILTFSYITTIAKDSRKLYYSLATLQLIVILLTATRSALLALIMLFGLGVVYLSFNGKDQVKKVSTILLIVGIILAGLFFVFRSELSQSRFEPIKRIASISLTEGTVSSRLYLWQNLLPEALKNPVFGYGAESIDRIFNKIYDPGLVYEQWFDRSHNAFLDYMLQYGLVGFLLFVLIILSILYGGYKLWKREDYIGVTLVALAFVYSVNNFFVFDTMMTLWLLLITLAITFVYLGDNTEHFAIGTKKYLGIVFAIIIILALIPVTIQPYRANKYFVEAYARQVDSISNMRKAIENGLSLGTYADLEYGYQIYTVYTQNQQPRLTGEALNTAYELAFETLNRNYQNYPFDARIATYLAHVMDLAPDSIGIDKEGLLAVIDHAQELSPKRAQPWYLKANVYIRSGDNAIGEEKTTAYRNAIEILEEYKTLVPKDAKTYFVLANLYSVLGESQLGESLAEEGKVVYQERKDEDSASQASRYYINKEDWTNAVVFIADIVRENPRDLESAYDLAKLYYLTGKTEESLIIVDQLIQRDRELVASDPAFLNAIGVKL